MIPFLHYHDALLGALLTCPLLTCLVSRVQNGGLVSVACTAMSDMAYIIPDLVLPLVHERFEARSPLPRPCHIPTTVT